MIEEFRGRKPNIHGSCYIHKTAQVIGHVDVGANTSIWPNVIIRGDMNLITIGENTNIQDNSTIHNGPDNPVVIEDNITIGHNCVVHGAHIKSNTLIGMGAILLNGSVVGENCLVGAGSVITEGQIIPDNSLAVGVPAKVVRKLTEHDKVRIRKNCKEYLELSKDYSE